MPFHLDIEVRKLTQRLQGLQGCHLEHKKIKPAPFCSHQKSNLFELVVIDGKKLQVGAVFQHFQPLAQPVFTDVQLGETCKFWEQLDVPEE